VGQALYTINDQGIARCYNARTGEVIWQKRLTQATSASPLYASGHIYIFSEGGDTVVFKPGSAEPEVVTTNTLQSGCMASPAVSGNALFLRTKTHLYRIEK
jgi:outer membrane protein assembly factor BamB